MDWLKTIVKLIMTDFKIKFSIDFKLSPNVIRVRLSLSNDPLAAQGSNSSSFLVVSQDLLFDCVEIRARHFKI